MTANALQEDRVQCLAAGMEGYLTKPLDFEEVGRVLREAASGADVHVPPVTNPGGPPSAARDENGLVDWSRLDELAEFDTDDRAVVRGAIASLADHAPGCLEEIRRGISGGDAALLRASAHKLKGAASNLGATALAACAADLESSAKSGTLDGAGAAVASLASTLEATLATLRRYADSPQQQDGV
jgi:HPt (histidine-containing phosphotransfer) domain-containing protein